MSEIRIPMSGTKELNKLYLDPNNYRFRNHKKYLPVEEKDFFSNQVQKRTNMIIEEQDGVKDLITSFKTNGFISHNPIQIEKFEEDKYLVREGNRRVVALKSIFEDHEKGADIGNFNPDSFNNIPVVYYDKGDSKDYFILMGLDHISGKKKWESVNQAEMIRDLIRVNKLKPREVAEVFGITLHRVNRSLRALLLIDEYKKSDFSDKFDPKMFNIFDEIASSVNMKNWIRWNDYVDEDGNQNFPEDKNNLTRLFTWMSQIHDMDTNEVKYPKKINSGDDIRDLSKIIFDNNALEELDRDNSSNALQNAIESSGVISESQFNKYIEKAKYDLDNSLEYANFKKDEILKEDDYISKTILDIQNTFTRIVNKLKSPSILPPALREIEFLEPKPISHFQFIEIKVYKSFKNIKIDKLKRINIFAGYNNSGKTTFLESVYLLCNLNNPNGLFEVFRKRGKFNDQIPSDWIVKQISFIKDIEVCGKFENKTYSTEIHFIQETLNNIDKSNYLGTIKNISSNGTGEFTSSSRILSNRFMDKFESLKSISRANYFSPFTTQFWEDVQKAHESSVEQKSIDKIIEFIQLYLDPKIQKIEKVGIEGDRFLVTHSDFEEAIDITHFGEGLQKIFFISLQFANSKNGILLIDEVENAIHHDLFVQFTKFIQILSQEFNVQVFLTSHSKECIDAFFENGLENEFISIYRLQKEKDNQIICKNVDGLLYTRLLENSIVDPRGSK